MVNDDGLRGKRMWQIIPDVPIEEQIIDLLVDPAPVSEKGNTGVDALITDTAHPI